MTIPTEQMVLSQLGIKGDEASIEPIADLLVALGFQDVAKELRRRWDDLTPEDDRHMF